MSSSTCRSDASAAVCRSDVSSVRPPRCCETLDQCSARRSERHAGHVVRHPRPKTDSRDTRRAEAQLERSPDTGRHLDRSLHHAHSCGDRARFLGCGRRELHRPGVRCRRRERSETDRHPHTELGRKIDHRRYERAPLEVGFGAYEVQDLCSGQVVTASQLERRPGEPLR